MKIDSGTYAIHSDRALGVLIISMRGFWDDSVVAAFLPEVGDAAARLPCGPGQQRVIVDVSEFAVQAQTILAKVVGYVRDTEPRPARIAWVGGHGLQRLQLRRSIAEIGGDVFDSVEDARAWLLSDG